VTFSDKLFRNLEESKINFIATHFRKMLVGVGKDGNILNTVICEWFEFTKMSEKFRFLGLPVKVFLMSTRFPLPSNILSAAAVLR
jgi:hypothetical protein